MNKNYETIDFSPESAPLRRTTLLIYGAAAAVLMLLLGRNALINSEGVLALCVREITMGMDVFAGEGVSVSRSAADLFAGRILSLLTGVTGISEWFLRLPAAFFAMLMFAGTMQLAGRLFDRKTAFTAGWLLLGSYGFLHWGRHISWHMMLTAWVVWCIVLMLKKEPDRTGGFFPALLFFLGLLLWGFYFLLPVLAVIFFFPPRIRVMPAVAALFPALGILLLLVHFPGRTPGADMEILLDTVWRNWMESFRMMIYPGGHVSWWQMWENLPRLLLPWTPVSLVALGGMFYRRRELPENVRKLLFAAVVMFLLTGIFPGKKWQYALPLLPLFTVLSAGGIAGECGVLNWNRIAETAMNWAFSLAGALTAAVVVTFPLWDMLLKASPPLTLMLLVPAMGFLAIALLIFDTGPTCAEEKVSGMCGSWSGYILAGVVLSAALWCVVIPSLTKFRTGRPFWKKCGAVVRSMPPENVIFAGVSPGALSYFYMDVRQKFAEVPQVTGVAGYCRGISGDAAVVITAKEQFGAIQLELLKTSWRIADSPLAVEGAPLILPGSDESSGGMAVYQLKRLPGKDVVPGGRMQTAI